MAATNTPLSVLIVDDEKKACANLKNLLKEYVGGDVHVAGMAYSTADAEDLIIKHAPDAVFLDIEMPHENAFRFLERISPVNFEVIFVTAYDEYALRAFKLNAVDYILKPISIDELAGAVEKLRERLRYKKIKADQATAYDELAKQVANKTKPTRITLKDANSIEVVEFRDIYLVEALSSYSRIVFQKGKEVKEMTMSNPLSDYEELFPTEMFYRVHRSYLVNCLQIGKIMKDESSQLTLKNNMVIPISRRRLPLLLTFLKTNEHNNE